MEYTKENFCEYIGKEFRGHFYKCDLPEGEECPNANPKYNPISGHCDPKSIIEARKPKKPKTFDEIEPKLTLEQLAERKKGPFGKLFERYEELVYKNK